MGTVPTRFEAGLTETIFIPENLMVPLAALAATRTDPAIALAGKLLFRVDEVRTLDSLGLINNRNFTRSIWSPARGAAGMNGDTSLPSNDPRSKNLKIKDLRAHTASMMIDSGFTRLEAASQLRHSDPRTTDKFYSRPLSAAHSSPERSAIRNNNSLTTPQRLSALFDAWVESDPETLKTALF